ncbi:sensor histidine kinase [Collinsella sp. An7]|uniref:histidine kinase n=1 Tax=Collinsella sp. An7 TaxID=1965651 RepID=UPI000B398396|nr:histidine kinase [Collinsella sp. An7]OUN46298.1 sensor histidine kinase [Collinsella sp. An7]
MASTYRGRHAADVALWAGTVVCALIVAVTLLYLLVARVEFTLTGIATVAFAVFFVLFVRLCRNPDTLRSRYTEETLSVASEMLENLKDGLTAEAATAICERLMPQTRASTIAITDTERVLACVGDMVEDFPPGSPIHTRATHYVIEHGLAQSFMHGAVARSEDGKPRQIPAGIIAPLKVGERTEGALKFYFSSPRLVNRTQYALVTGFAELLSTQLAIHELELQEELTARAEVRALQAQINPHFLFNTLNTIASFTRTDPMRARELLREFSAFYRSTLDNSGSLIPVEREVAQTRRYLTFEQARFGEDRIQATFEVDDDVADTLVPAFLIQPLVENAVRHALSDEGPLHIAVRVRADAPEDEGGRAAEGGDATGVDRAAAAGAAVDDADAAAPVNAVVIEVSDDGVGMDEETAARLFDASLPKPDVHAPQGSGAGVAMHNISERIRRFYGPHSFARVQSAPGEGTTVTLHLNLVDSIFAREDGVK